MMILCTHHSGGVGKTTLAVHIAGCLYLKRKDQILLMDCDSQADAWRFCTGRDPESEKELYEANSCLAVQWNPGRARIKRAELEDYDHIVLDIDSPLENTVQTITQNHPDLILAPINYSQQHKALYHLPKTLEVIAKLESKAGYVPKIRVVPLGVSENLVLEAIASTKEKPTDCKVAVAMENFQDEAKDAIAAREYLWNLDGCEHTLNYFCTLLGI